MCGIIGRINDKHQINKQLFTEMRDTLSHRGPNGYGSFYNKDQTVALGHRRLAFIDLSPAGEQPMSNETKKIWLTLNGEIYNYLELRTILKEKGHQFRSESDSEVVLHGYEEWGIDILQRLKGMFAFGIWDDEQKILFLARDRFGIKPLYYYKGQDSFIFASELKAIVKDPAVPRKINYTSFAEFFTYRYIPSPNTIWENIFKLPPAHYLIIKNWQTQPVRPYWELTTKNQLTDPTEAIEKVDQLFAASVKTHLQSDVPIGAFLSGGYDSSAIVKYMHDLNYSTESFSLGFKDWPQSEHQYAQIVADKFKVKNNSVIIGEESLSYLEKLAYVYDEPIADISTIPTYIISQSASKKVKAVLSGEGADEIFCGYTWHNEIYNQAFIEKLKNKISPINTPSDKNFIINYYSQAMAMGMFDQQALMFLLNKELHPYIPQNPFHFYDQCFQPDFSTTKQLQYLDIKTFMGELVLTKVDRASMANSLEVRVPFLDHELIEYVFNLREDIYFKRMYKKYLLYENIKNSLSKEILNRKKQGFVGPDNYYQNINLYKEFLLESNLVKANLISEKAIDCLLTTQDTWRLWKVLVMELWYREWMKN